MLTSDQIAHFRQNGFLVLPHLAHAPFLGEALILATQHLTDSIAPVELETDTGYPGAPATQHEEGGKTVRRLLQVSMRSKGLLDWATGAELGTPLKQLLGRDVVFSQVHHNCIMTKQPQFSSVTGWHRDSRYWHFKRAELISAWTALRSETVENGCLWIIPGSHLTQVPPGGLDEMQFLRLDYAPNQPLLSKARAVPLNAGDVLLFSSNLFHSAGQNKTDQTKLSLVFTYRAADNLPVEGSRSISLPEIPLN